MYFFSKSQAMNLETSSATLQGACFQNIPTTYRSHIKRFFIGKTPQFMLISFPSHLEMKQAS